MKPSELLAVRTTTKAFRSIDHCIDEIVDKVKSGLELASCRACRIGNHLTTADIQQ